MEQRLSQQEHELYKRVDEVLHYLWDPIGVSDCPDARDEYYSYLPKVYSLLIKGEDEKDIAAYLMGVVENAMALKPSRKRTKEIVRILVEWKKKIFNES